ncbi:uncharacterized protein MYCFIDRAFT_216034 [Pseudocercospora fijiensis CIRAD86]|uniref:Uncharacterized protein n=1 Tax=Pseudocercospora fijiensis (strain CIRAD86) TaxID=383855 RepID=M3A5M7_PSEFD|nr:uncharacterized protein MYCFIDRAFT_216034 [Pseudocercospora fijiensis CIRAD86]EME79926.1 hypothetical protein MYCFIDRAFT_216034 [Pseudocercospora fijiensis CIRAD86]
MNDHTGSGHQLCHPLAISKRTHAVEQPQAWTSNKITDSARVILGNRYHADLFNDDLSTTITYLAPLLVAYKTCKTILEKIANDKISVLAGTRKPKIINLMTLVEAKRYLLGDYQTALATSQRKCKERQIEVSDTETVRQMRIQDSRLRNLCTTVLNEIQEDPVKLEQEYSSSTTYEAHIKFVLEDVYVKSKPVLLEQMQLMEKAIAEKENQPQSAGEKMKAWFKPSQKAG